MYKFMFVMHAEIIHVQCDRGWYVETGYRKTIIRIMDVSGHAAASSLAWTHMKHARCTRWARRSLEEVLSIPVQFV